jgi:hypothetical protein
MKHPIENYGKPAPAGPGKDGFNTNKADSKDKNAHRHSKVRQDGVGQKDSVNAGDHLWKHENSEGVDPNDCY